jgi:hypothetical protein
MTRGKSAVKRCGTAALAMALACLLPGTAAAFSGPWDSAHEPPAVSNPGITVTPESSLKSVEVSIDPSVGCPNGNPVSLSVTFSDPSGSATDTIANPCSGSWTSAPSNGNLDFLTLPISPTPEWAGIPGDPPYVQPIPGTPPGPSNDTFELMAFESKSTNVPFVYSVSGPSGVLAEGADTAAVTVTPSIEVDQNSDIDNFINICIDEDYTVYSKDGGDLYCTIPGVTAMSFEPGGWPAPPPPTAPPSPPPAPKTYTMTLHNLRSYVRWTVLDDFYGSKNIPGMPAGLRVWSCKKLKQAGWFRCQLSWRRGVNTFAGSITMGAVNPKTDAFRSGGTVERTNTKTHAQMRIYL